MSLLFWNTVLTLIFVVFYCAGVQVFRVQEFVKPFDTDCSLLKNDYKIMKISQDKRGEKLKEIGIKIYQPE